MAKELTKAIETLARNGDQNDFARTVGELALFSLMSENSLVDQESEFFLPIRIKIDSDGKNITVIPIFGSQREAENFLKDSESKIIDSGPYSIKESRGRNLLFSFAAWGLPVWLNPGTIKNDKLKGGKLLSPAESASLAGALAEPPPITIIPEKSREDATDIQDLDLSISRTFEELCEIFSEEKAHDIRARLSRLTDNKIITTKMSPFDKKIRFYEPLAVFYLGFESKSARGDEFREWFKRLITTAYFERGDQAKEIINRTNEIMELKKELNFSESFKQKVKREYQRLKSKLDEEQKASEETIESILQELQDEKSKRQKDGVTIENLYRKIALLEHDLRSAEEWPHPSCLGEVLSAAEKLYSSKIVVAPGRNRVEVSDPAMETHQGLTAEAVKMIKALALTLHPMKFNYGALNEKRFREHTGIDLNLASGRDKASSTICTRRVEWSGQSYVCNNYLQSSKSNCRLLIHFTILEEERKILISHLTTFAISGLFKLISSSV